MSTNTIDYEAIKTKQQGAWSSGEYAVIGTTVQLVGETLCETIDVSAGELVLDVAAGNGNASLAAARRGAEVLATDYVPGLLEQLHGRAVAEGLDIAVREADAEALPFAVGTFDAVVSTFGVMFAPQHDRAASELLRVCKPGGRIGLANWTPDGFVGQFFAIVGRYVPPPAGLHSPLEWGTRAHMGELFPTGIDSIRVETQQFIFRYRSSRDWLDTFRQYYGPLFKAFAGLDDDGRAALERDLIALADSHNTSTNGTARIPSDYLEFVVTKAK